MSSYSLTKSRAFQYVGILLVLAALAAGYWYFSARAGTTLNKSPTSSLTSGLVGHWTFDGSDISGTTVTDRSGSGNNGTLSGGVTPTEGKIGQGMRFDGTNYIDAGDIVALDGAAALTVSVWVKHDTLMDSKKVLGKYHSAPGYHIDFGTSDVGAGGSNDVKFRTEYSVEAYTTSNIHAAGRWEHWVAVFDGTQTGNSNRLKIYVNGTQETLSFNGTIPATLPSHDYPFVIGDNANRDGDWNGTLDEIRLYNRALSATEVASLYDMGKVTVNTRPGDDPLEEGLSGYWKLDENTGTSAGDASGNASAGTLTNGPTWTTGRIGSGVDFDGTDDFITVADPASGVLDVDDTDDFTLTGWFNRDTFTTDDVVVAKRNGIVNSDDGYICYIDDATDKLTCEMSEISGTDEYQLESGTTFAATGWNHFALVWDQDSAAVTEIYINGRADAATKTGTIGNMGDLSTTLAFRMGAESDGGNPFDGKIDEVRLYNRALSPEEVRRLYQETHPDDPDTHLVGHWTFDGMDTNVAAGTTRDRSRGWITGTLTNGPTPAEGKLGQALDFDGVNDYVWNAWPAVTSAQKTISAWINPRTPGEGGVFGVYFDTGAGSDDGINLAVCHLDALECSSQPYTLEVFQFFSGANGIWHTGANTIKMNEWTHVVVVYDASSVTNDPVVYINGVLSPVTEAQTPAGTRNPDTYTQIGSASNAANFSFDGPIDDVRIYDTVLSASAIQSLYQRGASDKVNSSTSQPQGTGRLDSDLALYWPLDASSGTTATDSSTNGNNGTLTNMEDPGDWTTGQVGNALDFDGSNEYVTVADPASGVLDFDVAGPGGGRDVFTLTGWFNRDTFASDHTIVAKKNDQSTGIGYIVWIDGADDRLWVQLYGDNISQSTIASSRTFTSTGWHHFTIVIGYNAVDQEGFPLIFIDGVADYDPASGSGYMHYLDNIANALAFRVGAESDGGNPFDGKLDDIRVYRRALSADEISQLYRLTTPTGVDTSLKGYWSFNGQDMSSTTAYDRSGSGNNGTISGATPTEGKIGQGMSFDGVNDEIEVTDPGTGSILDFANGNNITLSVWIRPDTFDGTSGSIITKEINSSSASSNYAIQHPICSGSTCALIFYYDTGSCNETAQQIFTTSSAVLTAGIWQHVAATYTFGTGSSMKLYVNGTERAGSWTTGSGNVSPCQGNRELRIGIDYDGGTFDGRIDDFRVYNRGLSPSEVTQLYNMGR